MFRATAAGPYDDVVGELPPFLPHAAAQQTAPTMF